MLCINQGRNVLGSFLIKGVYGANVFILHAMSLDQAFAHCPIFSAAATRRCLGRVAVPVLGNKLSPPLTVIALVGRYPANKLMVRRLIINRLAPFEHILANVLDIGNYPVFRRTMPVSMVDYLRVTNPFAANLAPCARKSECPKSEIRNNFQNYNFQISKTRISFKNSIFENSNLFRVSKFDIRISWCRAQDSLDLHALSTLPAFILDQDQILRKRVQDNFKKFFACFC